MAQPITHSLGHCAAVVATVPPHCRCCCLQGFDWDALAARRMEPPRKPKTSDHAKRKVRLCGGRERSGDLQGGRTIVPLLC